MLYKVMGRGWGDGKKGVFGFVPSHKPPPAYVFCGFFSDPESSSSCVRPYNSFHLLYKSLGMRDKEEYNIRGHLSKEKKN